MEFLLHLSTNTRELSSSCFPTSKFLSRALFSPIYIAGMKRPWAEQSPVEDSLVDPGGELSVVYVCELPEVKGKFDLEKAQAFFTRAGPHYGQLQAGKSVMASDGVTMVCLIPVTFFHLLVLQRVPFLLVQGFSLYL